MFYLPKSMNLLYWQNKKKICLSIEISNKESQITTSLSSQGWSGSNKTRFTGKGAREKNEDLASLERTIHSIHDIAKGMGIAVTASLIRKTYKTLCKQAVSGKSIEAIIKASLPPPAKPLTLLEVVDKYIKRKKDIEKVSGATLQHYARRRRNLVYFLMSEDSLEITADEFTRPHLVRFGDYLLMRHGRNYSARHINLVKEALEEAYDRGEIKECYIGKFVISKTNDKDLRYITGKELNDIEELELTGRLDEVRDMFVFCCYTGFHYGDREAIAEATIIERNGGAFLRKERQKTGIFAELKLQPKAIEIIEKYHGLKNFPKFDNATNNLLLKVIEAMVGIAIGLCNKIARKTFTYHAINYHGIDLDTVAKMMGLSSTKHIADYAEVTLERVEQKAVFLEDVSSMDNKYTPKRKRTG